MISVSLKEDWGGFPKNLKPSGLNYIQKEESKDTYLSP